MARLQLSGLCIATFLALAITVTIASDQSEAVIFNPPYLLLALALAFWTTTTVAIAYVSAKSFLKEGATVVLLLASAVLVFGLSNIVASAVQPISGNASVAIGNSCLVVSSTLQVAAAIAASTDYLEGRLLFSRKTLLVVAYLCSILFVAAFSALVFADLVPPFFTVTGPTVLRQVVLGTAVSLLAVAFLIFVRQYLRTKSPGLYWYSLAVGLMSLGLFSAFENKQLGDLVTWFARATLYTASFFLLAALLQPGISERKPGTSIAARWTSTFSGNRSQIEALFSKMLNGFSYNRIIVDDAGKPVDYVILTANEAFEKQTGLKLETVIGKKMTEVLPGIERDPADWIGIYGKVALTGQAATFENHVQLLKKWYSISAYSPKKRYFVAILEDITERKKAEEEIKSLAKFPLENPAAVLRVDQRGTILFANPSANDFLEEWHTKVGEIVPEHVRQRVVDALTSKNRVEFEANLGQGIFAFLVAPIIAEGYANLYGRNITKRKRTEERLEEYTKNLEALVEERAQKLASTAVYTRSLIEASPDPLVTISPEGKITDVNKATELVTGNSREELIGSDFCDYFTEPMKARTGYRQVFIDGFVKDYPLAIRHKSGRITDVLYNASVYRDENGNVEGVFAAARDVTELRKAERQAEESARRLKDAERLAAIGATAGMVGHDIRNPLQAILGDLYLAKDEVSSLRSGAAKKNLDESIRGIEENVVYINKIVSDLQDYTRPLNPVLSKIDLQNICEDVLKKRTVPKNITISYKVAKNARQVMADPELLKRVINNLVTNAIQAMPNGGELSVGARRDERDIAIEIQDTGVGIPEDAKAKLFTPLFTTKSRGQGFGLAVVKRVTESMNGTVTFESQKGKGTKFIVRLPARKDSP